jgi:hypothetical protein
MSETQRLLQAAGALSQALSSRSIPHAFHGNVLIAVLANVPRSDVRLITLGTVLVFRVSYRRYFALSKAANITHSGTFAKQLQAASISP